MQKLKNSVVDTMIKLHLTKAEVDFMLELSQHQDDTGMVYGVYYKDMCKAIHVSYETFYVVLRSLKEKNLIKYTKNYHEDWDICIINNDISQGNYKDGYINTGHDMFYDKRFKALKAKEKLLAIQLFKIVGAGKRYHIGIENFFDKYCRLLGVAKRTLALYLHSLKLFFRFDIRNKNYWIIPLPGALKEIALTDLEALSYHLGKTAVRRNRAVYSTESLKDTLDLIKLYGHKLKEKTATVFLSSVRESIEKQNGRQTHRHRWNRKLNPKFIHKLIKQYL